MSAPGTRIYVGHLSTRTRDRDLDRAFSRFGRIEKVDVRLGYAFVEFDDPRDAEDAVRSMDGRELDGARIVVERGRGHRPNGPKGPTRRTDYRVKVTNLDAYTSWQDLKDFGRKAGQVLYSDVYMRQGQRFGVLEYVSKDDMKDAIRNLDDTRLGGQYVRVQKERRSNSRSRSRDSSRSRSRSADSRASSRGRDRGRKRSRSPEREKPTRSRSRSPARHSRSRSRSR